MGKSFRTVEATRKGARPSSNLPIIQLISKTVRLELPQCSSRREKNTRELAGCLSRNVERISCARPKPPFREDARDEPILWPTPIIAVLSVSRGTDVPDGPSAPTRLSPSSLLPSSSVSPSHFLRLVPRFESPVAANGPMAEKTAAAIETRNSRLKNKPCYSPR